MYESYAALYDEHQGDRAEHAEYVHSLIEQHHPDAKRVLELACGTGSILAVLQRDYDVIGVDLSEQMLDVARQKLPGVALVQADMTSVELGERFDVVLCLYDSINHLLRFDEWEAVFDRAREHLDEGGIFIFDINTEPRLAQFAEADALAEWFGDGHLAWIDVRAEDGAYLWDVRVFERVGDSEYRLHTQEIREASFPPARIRASLEERFSRLWRYGDEANRLHFVAQR